MKKLLFISILFLLAGCGEMHTQDAEPIIPCDTAYIPVKIEYNIPNNHREPFGGSPDVWAAGVNVTDSTGSLKFLFTEAELQFFRKRAERNATDTLK